MKLLVTGGAGFIGSTYVRLHRSAHDIVVLDKLTYAGRRENLPGDAELVVGGIEDRDVVMQVADGVDAIVNFAAESHVDRSIADQDVFARTHVIGTGVLLDAARELGVPRYLQVSTDEVYGSIQDGSFTETSPLDPSSPYSATKAAGDLLVSAHHHTYGTEAVICRGSNNYGPRQYPEKLIPLSILNAMHGDPLPVYGDGRQVRNWLYVEDFCRGIHAVLEGGRPGEAYNVGGPDECENIDVVRRILELTGRDESLIEHVTDRPGHDRRYSLSSDKLRSELGWEAQVRFEEGLARTVDWYRDNEEWWQPIRSGEYRELLREALRAGAWAERVTSLERVFRDPAPALQLRGLTKRYDDGTLALEDFDLEIPAGAFFGLLGPNGAGKTTLISAVCNLLRITDGEVLVFGEPHDTRRARAWVGPRRAGHQPRPLPDRARRRSSTTAATSAWTRTRSRGAPRR